VTDRKFSRGDAEIAEGKLISPRPLRLRASLPFMD
jgi:hypothetical protein